MAQSEPLEINRRLATELNSAAVHLVRRIRRTDAAMGLSPARASALSVLVFGGAKTLTELAAAEQVAAPTMSRIVTGLEQGGLARRQPHPGDARALQIEATARGRRVMLAGRDRRVAQLADDLVRLSAEERAALDRALPALRRIVQLG